MTATHFPGKLKVHRQIHDNDGMPETVITSVDGRAYVAVALDFGPNNPEMREANAKRLVACWNACEGLTQDHFDGDWTARGLSQYAKRIEDRLAAAHALLVDVANDSATTDHMAERINQLLKGGAA